MRAHATFHAHGLQAQSHFSRKYLDKSRFDL
jgi:hypothetical protein